MKQPNSVKHFIAELVGKRWNTWKVYSKRKKEDPVEIGWVIKNIKR